MKNRAVDYILLLKLSIPLMVLTGFGLYYLALKPTLDGYRSYDSLKSSEGMAAVGVSRGYTDRRASLVDILYTRMEVDTLTWKNRLWNYASELSKTHNSPVTAFPAVQGLAVQDEALLLQTVAFKGKYTDLMQLLKAISQEKHIGLPHSLRLRKKARDKDLVLTIDMAGKPKTSNKPIKL